MSRSFTARGCFSLELGLYDLTVKHATLSYFRWTNEHLPRAQFYSIWSLTQLIDRPVLCVFVFGRLDSCAWWLFERSSGLVRLKILCRWVWAMTLYKHAQTCRCTCLCRVLLDIWLCIICCLKPQCWTFDEPLTFTSPSVDPCCQGIKRSDLTGCLGDDFNFACCRSNEFAVCFLNHVDDNGSSTSASWQTGPFLMYCLVHDFSFFLTLNFDPINVRISLRAVTWLSVFHRLTQKTRYPSFIWNHNG